MAGFRVPVSLPPTRDPRGLFRAMLRECTYLPDPAARSVVADYVVARYRASQRPSTRKRGAGRTDGDVLVPRRRPRLITAARRGLSLLVRANRGESRPMLKVLLFTYGRMGRTRRELVTDLIRLDVDWKDPVTGISRRAAVPGQRDLRDWPPRSEKLKALVSSQIRQKLQSPLSRADLKYEQPRLPAENIWKRPLPKRREKNLRWKFYRTTLNRVMPPLPEHRWARLRDLADGLLPWTGPVARRSRPEGADAEESLLNVEFLSHRLDQQRHQLKEMDHPHRITARFMRRLWTRVFITCPVMKKEGESWQVKWGKTDTKSKNVRMADPSLLQSVFAEEDDVQTSQPTGKGGSGRVVVVGLQVNQ